jgi:hypothetical protein
MARAKLVKASPRSIRGHPASMEVVPIVLGVFVVVNGKSPAIVVPATADNDEPIPVPPDPVLLLLLLLLPLLLFPASRYLILDDPLEDRPGGVAAAAGETDRAVAVPPMAFGVASAVTCKRGGGADRVSVSVVRFPYSNSRLRTRYQ